MDISSLRDRPPGGALTVSELNNYVKGLLDRDRVLNAVTVTGEISNLTDHRSGHLYFTLKDSGAQIKSVMFRYARAKLRFMPEEGMKVTVHGTVSVYPQTGAVQLYANMITPDGVGALYKAYEQLKARLAEEGLFDEEHKKLLPRYPTRIGVITSPTGAAVRDIINVTGRRYPIAAVYLYPALVQGEGSEASLIKALDYLDNSGLCDVIIIGRGGGSIEDLWSFNSEALARRIYSAKTPIISAVGHETDFTICDFVADMRAPTPSAAAELSVPDIRDIVLGLDNCSDRIETALVRCVERMRERLARCTDRPIFSDSAYLTEAHFERVEDLFLNTKKALSDKLAELSSNLKLLSGKCDALSPLSVLSRGYSVVSGEGGIIKSIDGVEAGDELSLRFADGEARAKVTETKRSRTEE
ncbi:MAG: exodeoxyribonuclease VII large subunit [Clostridia bacterium]|nr:exodeoxyribonuclease VII large subunit [Clostridia bacterium]